jgi:hypothetical protein
MASLFKGWFVMKFVARTFVQPTSPEMLFPFLAYLMWIGVFLFNESGNFMFISISSGISSVLSAWLGVYMFRNREINLIRLVVYMSMFWYFFPLNYYKFIDLTGLLPRPVADFVSSMHFPSLANSHGSLDL